MRVINELPCMFQQEQVDSVEYFALQATERVEYGGQQLLKGTVSRRKAKNVSINKKENVKKVNCCSRNRNKSTCTHYKAESKNVEP